MIATSFVIASLLAGNNATQCTMNPLPLAVDAVRASKDVKSFVVASPKSMSLLLKDGTLIRVASMGCVDSGSVAHIWVNNPPPAEDEVAWRKLFIRIASAAFDPIDSKNFAAWLPSAKFTRTDRFILSAGISENVDLSIDVEPLIDERSAEITMSVTYH
ncbi:hypothetical protein DyAD56_22860 [Dyella sp. AD56]|uniref:hypothetical protein n=1 Tax=Dyella sp. AD56 TaxID=1528744 RepID=UPI000C850FF3|nr:hypothetical protein [Dyella sp. AD56]PMQ02720.1 hypothetical protein DyAD56_22860 [Dyella sp. AD56]